jgi:transcriptional regulator with XRE-family HTH domain
MSKRNQIIKINAKSKALKELRLKAGLGIRKLAERMNYSHTRVHQMESGRDEISASYVDCFLKATGFSREAWLCEVRGEDSFDELRDKCHEALDSIDSSKLKMIYELLTSF